MNCETLNELLSIMHYQEKLNYICLLIFIVVYEVSSVIHTTNLIWAQKAAQKIGLSKIVAIQGDPKTWISKSRSLGIRQISAPNAQWHFKALGYDFTRKMLYWSEGGNKRIQGLILNGSTVTTNLVLGTSSEVTGLVVDWISNNLYWTDAVYNWIMLIPLGSQVKAQRLIVDTGLQKPMGIAVYPQKGYLFWSDWGVKPVIEMSDLLGQNRRVIVKNQILRPRGLTVDFSENRLYWLDSALNTVESVDFGGMNRKPVVHQPGTQFYDIALYDKYIFVTETMRGHLQIYDKISGNNYLNYNLGTTPYGIIVYTGTLQTGQSDACENAGCEQICVQDPLTGAACSCGDDYQLQPDLKSCKKAPYFLDSTHIFTIGTAICFYPPNIADMQLANISLDTQCFHKQGFTYSALAYDVWDKVIFFSQTDNQTSEIMRYRLDLRQDKEIIVSGVGDVQGLAVDWITDNLYWTDFLFKHIKVSRTDGSHPRILINTSLVSPLGIAIDPHSRRLYWTDPGTPKIESSYLDGSDRQVLVESNTLRTPNHVFLDILANRLYWTDSGRDHIRVINLSTREMRTVTYIPNSETYGISVFKDYVLWTDRKDKNGIHIVRMSTGEKVRGIIHPTVGMATDILTFSKRNQPIQSPSGACLNYTGFCNPCTKESNGGCEQLCLANNSTNPICVCSVGYKPANTSCVRVYENKVNIDNFLLVSDATQKEIYQIPIESGVPSALKVTSHQLPVAIDYDPISNDVYWSDIRANVIKRINLDGTEDMVIKQLPSDSIADGLAVDYVNRLVYYTDTVQKVIAVVSMEAPFWGKRLILTGLQKPRGIVVDPLRAYMYWSDWGRNPGIMKGEMDGQYTYQIIKPFAGQAWPNGLAIDIWLGLLYWCDAKSNSIFRSDLEGKNVEVLITERFAHYFDIAIMGDYLYITDWSRKNIRKINRHKPNIIDPLNSQLYGRLNGICSYNASNVLQVISPCDKFNYNCTQLCLPRPGGAICACADGYALNSDFTSCTEVRSTTASQTVTGVTITHSVSIAVSSNDIISTTVSLQNSTNHIPKNITELSSITTILTTLGELSIEAKTLSIGAIIAITIIVILLAIAGSIAAVIIYRRRHSGGREKLVEDVSPNVQYHISYKNGAELDSNGIHHGIENPVYSCTITALQNHG